jgi:hypothetical protein
MQEEEIFNRYLKLIKKEYEQSDIKLYNWHYSLSSTPLYLNAVVLCGFNWGVNEPHSPQDQCPTIEFMENDDLGSLSRIKGYLKKYLDEKLTKKIVQINLCFFRSKRQADISTKDFNANKEIFISLVKELQPSLFIALSSKIYDVLKPNLQFEYIKTIKSRNKKIQVIKASFNADFGKGNFVYLPHPNYPLTTEARNEAWQYALIDNKFN